MSNSADTPGAHPGQGGSENGEGPGGRGAPEGQEAPEAEEIPRGGESPEDGEAPGRATEGTPADAPDDPETSAGTPPDGGDDSEQDAGPETAPAPRRRSRRRKVLKALAIGTAVLLVATAGTAYALYRKLNANIRTDEATAQILHEYESERPRRVEHQNAQNILLIGSDDRSGSNARYGGDEGSQRSDTTILLHLAEDRRGATAMSIPRDLMVQIPACATPDGGETRSQFAQFNWAFQFGGAACTIRTVENMTGIRIDHHLIMDFTGFKKMVDAVDGVEICLPEAVRDDAAKLDLPAGRQTVRGEDALAYVRARKSIGNGSDTQRMDRQQQFLASLVRKVKSGGVLLNPTKLYSVLDAATSSLIADEGLDSLGELYKLARGLERTPTQDVVFLTVPREPYVVDPNRDQLVQPEASALFTALREDRPIQVNEDDDGTGTPTGTETVDAEATGTPGMSETSGDKETTAAPETTGSTPPPGTPGGVASGQPDAEEGDDAASPSSSAATPDPSASASSSASGSPPASTEEPAFRGTTADRDICGEG
ncbi:LCP family protein [Wenjunlia vitaminophila]|uniref:LCP family protein n=1 Tax=Wenjunlia vitaminophila TaxID=76728 RepID=UPI000362B8D8|nr:LCP family protein [Wenjunlia vitaminophila]